MRSHKLFCVFLVLCLLAGLISGCGGTEQALQPEQTVETDPTERAGALSEQAVEEAGAIFLTNFTDREIYGEANATGALEDAAWFLGIQSVDWELQRYETSTSGDTTFYRYRQMAGGVAVYGRGVVLAVGPDYKVQALSSNILDLSDFSPSGTLSREEARDLLWDRYEQLDYVFPGERTVYSLHGTEPTLCWVFQVIGPELSELVFVDANTGEVVAVQSQLQTNVATGRYTYEENGAERTQIFNTTDNGNGTYSLVDPVRNITIYDAAGYLMYRALEGSDGTIYPSMTMKTTPWYAPDGSKVTGEYNLDAGGIRIYDENGYVLDDCARVVPCVTLAHLAPELTSVIVDQKSLHAIGLGVDTPYVKLGPVTGTDQQWDGHAAEAMAVVTDIYNMFALEFGRNGFNGNNGAVSVVVNDGVIMGENAFSSYGESGQYTIISVGILTEHSVETIAHEYTHSVERSISNLAAEGESGAISEAMSDVFGELAEDWTEDGKWDDSCSWDNTARNLKDPLSEDMPVKYRGENDTRDFHKRSTVISHACYRMTHPEDPDVTALTNRELGALLLYNMEFLPQDCDYTTFATSLRVSAELLGYSPEKTAAVMAALTAAGINPGIPVDIQRALAPMDFVVNSDAKWFVRDEAGKLCKNYSVTVAGKTTMRNFFGTEQEPASADRQTDACTGPSVLPLEPGYVYQLTFTDGVDPQRQKIVQVGVMKNGGLDQVELNTNFKALDEPMSPEGDNRLYVPVVQGVISRVCGHERHQRGLLMDLNGDGVEELVLCYAVPTGGTPECQEHIEMWSRETGAAVKLLDSDDYTYFHSGQITNDSLLDQYNLIWMTEEKTCIALLRITQGCSYGMWNRAEDFWRSHMISFFDLGVGSCTLLRTGNQVELTGKGMLYLVDGRQTTIEEYGQTYADAAGTYLGVSDREVAKPRVDTPLTELVEILAMG